MAGAVRTNGGPIEIYHTGIDYAAAAEGTTVLAPANGVVVFSDVLELRGGTLIIDHGLGVMTGLSSIRAVGGARTSGHSRAADRPRRVNRPVKGAHLHWDCAS